MQTIKIDSLTRGLFSRAELWRVFYAFWMAMALMLMGFFLALAIMPGLSVWAIFFPVLIFAGLCFWKLKDYKARVVNPVDAIIRQADMGERIGIFLFLSFFMGAIGWGGSFFLLFFVYSNMADNMPVDLSVGLGPALFYGSILGAVMAAFKFADIFKKKEITYALYALLALIFIYSQL